jgi:hypothetical protein
MSEPQLRNLLDKNKITLTEYIRLVELLNGLVIC